MPVATGLHLPCMNFVHSRAPCHRCMPPDSIASQASARQSTSRYRSHPRPPCFPHLWISRSCLTIHLLHAHLDHQEYAYGPQCCSGAQVRTWYQLQWHLVEMPIINPNNYFERVLFIVSAGGQLSAYLLQTWFAQACVRCNYALLQWPQQSHGHRTCFILSMLWLATFRG